MPYSASRTGQDSTPCLGSLGKLASRPPGARWFKADLHVHTIDDLPGGRAKMPPGLPGPAASDQAITAYARCFLKEAVERNVRVIAVTPHSPRIDASRQIGAAWRIVEEWNAGMDDDGTPFRDKVYAVFPATRQLAPTW